MQPVFRRSLRRVLVLPLALVCLSVLAPPAGANHSWRGYHWARSSPFTLQLGSNLSRLWQSHLFTTAADWSKSTVLDTTVTTGRTTPSACNPSLGRVEVCNSSYGLNGWLGAASVWTYGGHITQGVVKMNDSYFSRAFYNTSAWRNHVLCQEVGHTLGLYHQDESGADLGTCMDYARNPVNSQRPNAHDYAQLEEIYAHSDGSTSVATSRSALARASAEGTREWGRAIRYEARTGRPVLFERHLRGSERIYTWVTWAE